MLLDCKGKIQSEIINHKFVSFIIPYSYNLRERVIFYFIFPVCSPCKRRNYALLNLQKPSQFIIHLVRPRWIFKYAAIFVTSINIPSYIDFNFQKPVPLSMAKILAFGEPRGCDPSSLRTEKDDERESKNQLKCERGI